MQTTILVLLVDFCDLLVGCIAAFSGATVGPTNKHDKGKFSRKSHNSLSFTHHDSIHDAKRSSQIYLSQPK
jgi:hypothetical protein